MNDELKRKWDEAERTGEHVEVGRLVVCDQCDDDYTDKPDSGGFIFCSHAYCPKCAAKSMPSIIGFNEQHMIRAVCLPGQSFADFVREYRGPNAGIKISSF